MPFELDPAALDRFFVYGYPPGPGSMVKECGSCLPGAR